jgi:hypothetical protein
MLSQTIEIKKAEPMNTVEDENCLKINNIWKSDFFN